MVSSTLCPAVHILGSQNVYGRAEGIADHYWPWAVFFHLPLFPGDDENVPFRKSLTFMSFYINVFTKMSLYQNVSFYVSFIM